MLNGRTSSAFLKRGGYIEKEKLLLNLSDIEDFYRIERILGKIFLKKIISVVLWTFIIKGMY